MEHTTALPAITKNYKAAQFAIGKGYESDMVWFTIKLHFPEI